MLLLVFVLLTLFSSGVGTLASGGDTLASGGDTLASGAPNVNAVSLVLVLLALLVLLLSGADALYFGTPNVYATAYARSVGSAGSVHFWYF